MQKFSGCRSVACSVVAAWSLAARALQGRELEDELANEGDVFLRRSDDARFIGVSLHSRIIRLAESGVNAIFRG